MTVQTCERCGEHWCDDCDPDRGSTVDGETWCSDCTDRRAWYCDRCEEYHADNNLDQHNCANCGVTACASDWDGSGYVDHDWYCSSCYDDAAERADSDDDTVEPSPDSIAEYHGTNVQYEAKTQAIGLEIELNFDRAKKQAVLDAVRSALKLEYHWERDGSIGEGAELITHPATLEELRQSGLRDALKAAWTAGARGYDSGKCGIHIHVSRDQLVPSKHSRLKRFFILNQDKIESFAARKSNTYANYPSTVDSADWDLSKYSCINFRHENSLEFRVFRGTTNYDRLRASVDFCLALCEYLQGLSEYQVRYCSALSYWQFTRWCEVNKKSKYLQERLRVAGWHDLSTIDATEQTY